LGRGHELLRRETELVPAEWYLRVDVVVRAGHPVLRADLSGLSKDDNKIEVTVAVLTIQGERKHETNEKRRTP
jgi:HSP20 family protein